MSTAVWRLKIQQTETLYLMFLWRLQKTWICSMQRRDLQVRPIMLCMLWETCARSSFYQFICEPDKFIWIVTMYTIRKRLTSFSNMWVKIWTITENPKLTLKNILRFTKMYMLVVSKILHPKQKTWNWFSNILYVLHFKDWADKKNKRVKSPGKSA